jgi:hypothetical protein
MKDRLPIWLRGRYGAGLLDDANWLDSENGDAELKLLVAVSCLCSRWTLNVSVIQTAIFFISCTQSSLSVKRNRKITQKRKCSLPHLTEDSQKFLVLILIQWMKQQLIQQECIKGILETYQCLLLLPLQTNIQLSWRKNCGTVFNLHR